MSLPLLGGALALALIVPMVVKVLLAFGIGIVSYTGAEFVLTQAQSYIFTNMGTLSQTAYSIMVMAGFDEGFKILFAGYSAQITIMTTLGSFRKISFFSSGD